MPICSIAFDGCREGLQLEAQKQLSLLIDGHVILRPPRKVLLEIPFSDSYIAGFQQRLFLDHPYRQRTSCILFLASID